MKPFSIVVGVTALWSLAAADEEEKVSYDNYQVVRVSIEDQVELVEGLIESLDLPTWGGALRENRRVDVVLPPENQEEFFGAIEAEDLEYVILHEDLGESIAEQEEYPPYSRDLITEGTWFDTYHDFMDHRRFFYDLTVLRPHNTEIFTIGDSVEGRPLVGMRIFKDKYEHKPAVVLHATTHAREWIAPANLEYIAHSLLVGEGTSPELQEYLDTFDFYLFQIINPDGFYYSKNVDRLWRKNRQVINETSGCVGIDTNRNWPAFWDAAQGGSTDPCSNLYKGTEPAQAPEIAAQVKFLSHISKFDGGIKLYIDIHSYGQQVAYPYGYDCNVDPPTEDALVRLGDAAAEEMEDVAGTDYEVSQTCTFFNISGGSADWVYENAGAPYSYLLESRDDAEDEDGGFGFVLPKEQIRETGRETAAGVERMLELIEREMGGYNVVDDDESSSSSDEDEEEEEEEEKEEYNYSYEYDFERDGEGEYEQEGVDLLKELKNGESTVEPRPEGYRVEREGEYGRVQY